MTEPADAHLWRDQKIGSVRGITVDVSKRPDEPDELVVRLLSSDLDISPSVIATLRIDQKDEAVALGVAMLKTLQAAEETWFRIVP